MSRVIKFRVWDKTDKVMIYNTDKILININGEVLIGDDYCGACDQNKYSTEEMPTFELMQFTGLHDKNGKEIYEGDIVRVFEVHENKNVEFISPVYFVDYMFCVSSSKEQEYDTPLVCIDMTRNWVNSLVEVEVIGNIYENSDLINE